MSALAYIHGANVDGEDRSASRPDGPNQPRLFALAGGRAPVAAGPAGPTLDDVLTGAWQAISHGATASCPVCTGTLEPRWSAGAGAVGARCRSCGSTLD